MTITLVPPVAVFDDEPEPYAVAPLAVSGTDDWRKLAQPVYAVTMLGDAYQLPAGLPCRVAEARHDLPGTVVLETDVPKVDLGYVPPTYWFVTASALRFEGASDADRYSERIRLARELGQSCRQSSIAPTAEKAFAWVSRAAELLQADNPTTAGPNVRMLLRGLSYQLADVRAEFVAGWELRFEDPA